MELDKKLKRTKQSLRFVWVLIGIIYIPAVIHVCIWIIPEESPTDLFAVLLWIIPFSVLGYVRNTLRISYNKAFADFLFTDVLKNYFPPLPCENFIEEVKPCIKPLVNEQGDVNFNKLLQKIWKLHQFYKGDYKGYTVRFNRLYMGKVKEAFRIGQCFSVELPIKFEHDVQITTKSLNPIMNLSKTESMEFNNKFTVEGASDLEAFKIITPPLMEKVLRLNEKHDGELIFNFVENKFYLYLFNSNKELFKQSLSDIKQSYKGMYNEKNTLELRAQFEKEVKNILEIFDVLFECEALKTGYF